MPARKTGEEMNFTYVECLLYTFHHLSNKVSETFILLQNYSLTIHPFLIGNLTRQAPNATNSLCGYKIVTGQPSDRLGEDFSEFYKDFTER